MTTPTPPVSTPKTPVKRPYVMEAVLLGVYVALVLVGVLITATVLGAPAGIPMMVVGVKRGWRAIKAL